MLFLCFVLLVCFLLHCGVDDKECECILHHEPVLCNLLFKDTVDIVRDFKHQSVLTVWCPSKELEEIVMNGNNDLDISSQLWYKFILLIKCSPFGHFIALRSMVHMEVLEQCTDACF